MSVFLQENIKETLNSTRSPFFMDPQKFWFRQANAQLFGEALLEIPVNANLREEYNQDQTLYPITVYYVICREYGDFSVFWLPLLEQFIQVKHSNDPERQKKLIQDEIKKAIFGYTKGGWQNVLLEAGSVACFDVKQFTFTVDLPIASEQYSQGNSSKKNSSFFSYSQSQELPNKQIAISIETGLTQIRESDCAAFSQIVGFEDEVERMHESLTLEQPVSVLIVGDPGVGKTSLWKRFTQIVTRLEKPVSCYYTTPLKLAANDSDAGFQPDDRLEKIVQFAKNNQGVYYLGNLWELAQIGTYHNHPVSVADYLVPHLEKKDLGVVVECSNEQYAELEKTRPGLIQMFDIIKIEPANSSLTNEILTKNAESYEEITVTPEAISTITELYKKYSAYENLPGAAVQFLDLLLSKNIGIGEKIVDKSQVIDFFTHQTGLPHFLLDPAIPFDKTEARKFFTSRVIGQDGTSENGVKDNNDINAVDTVVELLETVKSGLTRQTGPIATLLFIGPTGVGKTEMAKALAEYLYSDPRRMIRLDMSEYSNPASADRLINGLNGGEGVLTSQVRAQPFGVVLLDEFEKADPAVFDMFLQVMGEGRLTDAQGRLAIFNNCVIILTSNLGVDTFGKTSLAMKQTHEDSSQSHFTESVAKLVRPELLNRIDRIVPFSPLSKSVLRQILKLEFKSVNHRLGVRWRKLNISYDDSVIDKLVELGYSPQFGARPLRRTVEMYILHPLAEAMAKRDSIIPYDVHFSFSGDPDKKSADSVKPETLFTISVKAKKKEADSESDKSKSKAADAQSDIPDASLDDPQGDLFASNDDSESDVPEVSVDQAAECLKLYRSLVRCINFVYDSSFMESLQSDLLYDEQLLQSNNLRMKEQDSQQMMLKLYTSRDFLHRLYQIRKKAYAMENDVVFDYFTSKDLFSLRVAESVSPNSEIGAAIHEWNELLQDLYIYKRGFNKKSSYVAYVTADKPSILLFFDLLFRALIPNDSLIESCLLNKYACNIPVYLSKINSVSSVYHWFDSYGTLHIEKDKNKLRRIIQASFPQEFSVSKRKNEQDSETSSLQNFESVMLDYNPDAMKDCFIAKASPSEYNSLVFETDDSHAIALLCALTGNYSFNILDDDVESKTGKKKNEKKKKGISKISASVFVCSSEDCKKSLPDYVRTTQLNIGNDTFQFRLSSSTFPTEYSSGTYFTLSDSDGQSEKYTFEIDSIQRCFREYLIKYIYLNF